MADWSKLRSRGNVTDRRAFGPAKLGGGVSIAGIALLFLFNYLGGGSVEDVLPQVLNQLESPQITEQGNFDASQFEGEDSYEVFVATVLGSANDMWARVFSQNNKEYVAPELVLFRGATNSSCGGASSAIGPHYCPPDETIYLDETFFDDLTKKLGAKGGDVAQAYVIAHEVGHHVQHELGLLESGGNNENSIAQELQADCFAGLWAYSIKDKGVFLPGEIAEAMDAAAAVGDDRVQQNLEGRVNSETWTHGSSENRVASFTKGYESGSLAACGMNGGI